MKCRIQSKGFFGAALITLFLWASCGAMAQQPAPAAAGGAGDILRIRKMTPVKEKTPVFRTATASSTSARQPDWWRVIVDFETAPDWIDELEFTYYAYIEDQSNKGAPVMFRGTVTYVNVAKGKHISDMFLHPNTIARLGLVKQIAVVVKARGAVVAMESTAAKPNWWDGFSPVDGVLISRAQTPFAFVDYDMYEAIKPATVAR